MILFSATIFLSAALLFLVEPMFTKFILPLFGSTPAVWTTAMLFFQATLLAGYAYVHLTARLGARRQAVVHLGLVLLPLLVLPIAVPAGWVPPAQSNPVLWLLGLLVVSVGLPFFAVATTNPLIQRWLAATDHSAARDPYFLYRASNLGSILGLLVYPLVVEPHLKLANQSYLWTVGYALLLALVLASAVALWRSPPPVATTREDEGDRVSGGDGSSGNFAANPSEGLSLTRRLRWVGLAFVPSSLMLGVTAFVTTDVTPIPLLWVIPLSLYLFSFVIVFSRRNRVPDLLHRATVLALPVAVALLTLTMLTEVQLPFWLLMAIHLSTFFIAAVMCHGELAKDRPSAGYLTEFYLWVAVGGALGGVFNALIAPATFYTMVEYPLAITLACLFMPRLIRDRRTAYTQRWFDPRGLHPLTPPLVLGAALVALALVLGSAPDQDPDEVLALWRLVVGLAAGMFLYLLARLFLPPLVRGGRNFLGARRRRPGPRSLDLALPLALGIAVAGFSLALEYVYSNDPNEALHWWQLLIGLAVGLCLYFAYSAERPVRFGLGIAAVMLVAGNIQVGTLDQVLYKDRSFFGAYEVLSDNLGDGQGEYHALMHGTTNHGAEVLDGSTPPQPTLYHHRTGPIGQLFDALPNEDLASQTAVLGLGAGSMACYSKPGQQWTFYEIDPVIERIARDPNLFTYLRDCPGEFNVILGDARLELTNAPEAGYGLIVADAFNSDAVPVHLLTREAIDLYLSRLKRDGVLAFDISNRYVELEPVLGNLAQDRGLYCLGQYDEETEDEPYKLESHWVVMARDPTDLGKLVDDSRWHPCSRKDGSEVWTDDFSDLLSNFDWR